jgi:hypothetical protein
MKTATTTPNSLIWFENVKKVVRWTFVAVGTFALFVFALLLGLIIVL